MSHIFLVGFGSSRTGLTQRSSILSFSWCFHSRSATPNSSTAKAAYVRPESAALPTLLPSAPDPTLPPSTSSSRLTYERPPPIPGAIIPPPGPQIAKKADGALPLSAVEKARSLSAKLTLAFPTEPNFHPVRAAHIYLPSTSLAISTTTKISPPVVGTLHGFWPAPPPLNSGKGLYPAPVNIPEPLLDEIDDLRPRVDIFVDNSNILYSFLNWVRDRPEAKIKEWSNGSGKTSKTVTISGHKAKLDYAALFAILERGRKVEKRVLVGSSPLWQGLEVALDWVRCFFNALLLLS